MDWTKYLPSGLPQYLKEETFACSCYAPVDAIETQELAITGVSSQYSRRWLAHVSGTNSVDGNSEYTVFSFIQKYGLVLESSWPQRSDMTDAEYYTPPTPAEQEVLLAEGKKWLEKWNVEAAYDIPFTEISKAPLIAWINGGSYLHFIEVLSSNWYYDSEYHRGSIGVCPPYGKVIKYFQIIINRKENKMLVFFQVKGNPTLWNLDQGEWVGFSDMDAFNKHLNGRPNVVLELDQVEFNKLKINPDVYKK